MKMRMRRKRRRKERGVSMATITNASLLKTSDFLHAVLITTHFPPIPLLCILSTDLSSLNRKQCKGNRNRK